LAWRPQNRQPSFDHVSAAKPVNAPMSPPWPKVIQEPGLSPRPALSNAPGFTDGAIDFLFQVKKAPRETPSARTQRSRNGWRMPNGRL